MELTAPMIMALVAAAAAAGAIAVLVRRAGDEAATYRRRIAGTMLGAFAIMLGGYAYALQSWSAQP
jgi:hypothetical protein